MRTVSSILAVAALVLAVVGLRSALTPTCSEPPRLTAEAPDLDLGQFAVGESDVTFRISNTSHRPARIVGSAFG